MEMIDIDGIGIPLHDEPTAMIMSGGTDSSLLAYLLLSHSRHRLHIYTCSSRAKGLGNAAISSRVLSECVRMTGNMNLIHHTFYVDIQNRETLFGYVISDMSLRGLRWLYTGITANPSLQVANSFTENGANDNTEHDSRDPDIARSIVEEGWVINPFTNIDKRRIASIYDRLDLRSTLFPMTRSCEHVGDEHDETHCGACWWCRERIWGFGYL